MSIDNTQIEETALALHSLYVDQFMYESGKMPLTYSYSSASVSTAVCFAHRDGLITDSEFERILGCLRR